MSVTFALRSCVTEEDFLNVSNVNARDILNTIGVPDESDGELYGKMNAKAFEVMVRRAMMRVGLDAAKPAVEIPAIATPDGWGARAVICGRPEGYLRGKLLALMEICQARISDEDEISWG